MCRGPLKCPNCGNSDNLRQTNVETKKFLIKYLIECASCGTRFYYTESVAKCTFET
ncbi:hypothetical protein Ferp_0396 [Ferroglobus placidus DSM 10642]|uniref:Uncharacterized protein n=1 Tax=Ferroglobus placidus (strain DSM 10642 / AEDII12DO) TaxID=589924 RepID=D3S2P3_FERPA|nr:hypothetical protein Ferp_0396 [Ferroglobus placidus DSM 10642]